VTEETAKAVAVCAMCLVFAVAIIGITFGMNDTHPRHDDRIERLEQKVDQIHRIIVGGKP